MTDNIFIIACVDYETYVPYYFHGPAEASQEDFQQLCDSLLEQAGHNSIVNELNKEYPSFVGWDGVVESLFPLLEKYGYYKFQPKLIEYNGTCIINQYATIDGLGSSAQPILNYNQKVYEKLADRRHNNRYQ